MYDKLTDHEDRIIILEKSDVEILKRVKEVESNYMSLENTILKGNQQQQEFFSKTMDKQWDLITEKDASKETQRQREHEIAIANQAIKKSNSEKAWELAGKAILSGGVLYLIIEQFFV